MTGLRTRPQYEEGFKRQVVAEVMRGDISQSAARRKYGILGHSTIKKWIVKYEGIPKPTKLWPMAKTPKLSPEEYEKRIRELERMLEDERLRRVGYEQMIKIAERELDIRIEKKSDTKQSKR